MGVKRHHRREKELRIVRESRGCAIRSRVGPAGECLGKGLHMLFGVWLDRVASSIQHWCAVRVEKRSSQSEKLHQLTGVILVGDLPGDGIWLVAIHHVQIGSHSRRKGHIFHDGEVIGECIPGEHVEVARHSVATRDFHRGDHEDLRQRKSYALSKLVWASERILKKRLLHTGNAVVHANRRQWRRRQRDLRLRGGKLLVDPALKTDTLHMSYISEGWAPTCLVEKAGVGGNIRS